MIGKTGFVVIAVVSALIGAHSLNPRELYNEMYPVETLKRDAFHICHAADPAFVRAFKVDRETCYDHMPNAIEVALGRVRPGAVKAALLDPSQQAELLIALAAMPPRQPVVVPRSLADTAGANALSPCAKGGPPAAAAIAAGRTAALDTTILGNLPPIPRAAPNPVARRVQPPQPLAPGVAGTANGIGFDPVSTSDVGDKGPPAIVPLAPATACNDGA
jgi:hypothetical protein